MRMLHSLRQHYAAAAMLVVFGIVFCLISIVNHNCFRTYALDLGMYNHSLYQYSTFQNPQFTVGLNDVMPEMADHFSPIIALLSPLRYLFGNYTALLVQIFALLLGGAYIYRIALSRKLEIPLAVLCTLFYLSIWGIYGALSFDFHTNVLAAGLFPAFFYYLLEKNNRKTALITLLILLCKENMGFWLCFLFLAFWIRSTYLREHRHLFYGTWIALSGTVFLLVVFVIMPSIEGVKQNHSLTQLFGHISPDMKVVVKHLITHPMELVELLYKNPEGSISDAKVLTWKMMIVSGLIFIVYRPWTLVMLGPIIAQKFITSHPALSSIQGQYSVEFVPIVAFALVLSLSHTRKTSLNVVLVLLSTWLAGYHTYRVIILVNERTNFLSRAHYEPQISVGEFKKSAELIPPNASISCSSALVPHLTMRDRIYHYPIHGEAEYIMLITDPRSSYPMPGEDYMVAMEGWKADPSVKILYHGNDILLIQKTNFQNLEDK